MSKPPSDNPTKPAKPVQPIKTALSQKEQEKAARDARVAQRLRDNLRRRKAATRKPPPS